MHGHVTPLPGGWKASCGGVEKCAACAAELAAKTENEARREGDPRAHPESQGIVRRRINELVTVLGPEPLNDGMPVWEAMYKIMACLEEADHRARELAEMRDQIEHLKAVISRRDEKAKRADDGFEYRITTGGRKAWDGDPDLSKEGWEEWKPWERFDYHEERYWRRRKAVTT